MRATFAVVVLTASSLHAAAMAGFRPQLLGSTAGFADSIAVDSRGTIYYTTTAGDLFRFVNGQSARVAHVATVPIGDSGLLGLALQNDRTAIVHYTTPGQVADVISAIDLDSGRETVLHSFIADIDVPQRGSPAEHHGGNPSVAVDGSIFVGIGDYGGGVVASLPDWNGGKIFRLFPDGRVQQFARGFRNPFDMVWDAVHQRLIAPDNGAAIDDEINIVHQGDFAGWPFTMGKGPAIDGALAPSYVFSTIIAPTGMTALSGRNDLLRSGYLLGSFVAKALYYIRDVDALPSHEPVALIDHETGPIIDVAEGPNGDIDFVTGTAVYRLIVPARGDCNGDGLVNAADLLALREILASSNAHPSLSCDVNGDGVVDDRDLAALASMVTIRSRAVRP